MRDNSAVSSGATAMVTSTRATPVIVSATMKAVNMVAQHSPASQNARRRHGKRANTPGPCHSGRITSSASTVKKLRQNVTSKPCAACNWRVTTPAVDHISVASTISHTARVWDQGELLTTGARCRARHLWARAWKS